LGKNNEIIFRNFIIVLEATEHEVIATQCAEVFEESVVSSENEEGLCRVEFTQ